MCRKLGFKYAPEIRFFYSKFDESIDQIQEEIENTRPDIIRSKIQDEIRKGNVLNAEDFNTKILQIENDLDSDVINQMSQYSQKRLANSRKSRVKYDEEGKRLRENKDNDGNKIKKKKKSAGDKFWDSLL